MTTQGRAAGSLLELDKEGFLKRAGNTSMKKTVRTLFGRLRALLTLIPFFILIDSKNVSLPTASSSLRHYSILNSLIVRLSRDSRYDIIFKIY